MWPELPLQPEVGDLPLTQTEPICFSRQPLDLRGEFADRARGASVPWEQLAEVPL